jgi:hypothetical protein
MRMRFENQFGAGLPDDIFSKQKFPILGSFGGYFNGRVLYILWQFGIFHTHLEYFWLYNKFYGH